MCSLTDHLEKTYLNFHCNESLSVVDTTHGSDHFGNDNHVTEMSLDSLGLLADWDILTALAEALDQSHGLSLHASAESSAGTCMDQGSQLLVGELSKL